jgi:hypothetical protein
MKSPKCPKFFPFFFLKKKIRVANHPHSSQMSPLAKMTMTKLPLNPITTMGHGVAETTQIPAKWGWLVTPK